MAVLEQQENGGGTGFSDEELTVIISGPTSFDVTLVDLPGEKPDQDHKENVHIRKMIAGYCGQPHVVPLIVTAFHSSGDVEHTAGELTRLLRAMGSHDAQKKALVLVSRLDKIRQEGNPQKLCDMESTIEKVGLSKSRTCFISLKPHLFTGEKDSGSDATDHPDFNFDTQDEYFRNIAKVDAEMMKVHASDLIPPGGGLHLGLQSVHKMLQEAQVTSLKLRVRTIHAQLACNGKEFRDKVKNIEHFSEEHIRDAMHAYTMFMARLGGAMVTGDIGAWRKAVQAGQHGVEPKDMTGIRDSCNMSFLEEFSKFSSDFSVDKADTIFFEREPQQRQIADLMDQKKHGSAAVKRLGQLWSYKMMSQPLKDFSIDEMSNFSGWSDNNGVRNVNVGLIIRDCVNELCESVVRSSIGPLCKWIAQLYIGMARVTCLQAKEICGKTGLTGEESIIRRLDAHPHLCGILDSKLDEIFDDIFSDLADRTATEINDLMNLRLASLNLDEIYSLIRLLGCSGLSTNMLQQEGDAVQKEVQKNQSPLVQSAGSLQECFKQLPKATAEQFAMGDGMQLRQITDMSDLQKHAGYINEKVHTFTRVTIGLLTRDALNSIEWRMVAQKLPMMEMLMKPIQVALGELQSEKAIDKLLHADSITRKQDHRNLLSAFESHVAIVAAMNDSAAESDYEIPIVQSAARDEAECQKLRCVVERYGAQQTSMTCESDSDGEPQDQGRRARAYAAQIRCLRNSLPKEQLGNLKTENLQLRSEMSRMKEELDNNRHQPSQFVQSDATTVIRQTQIIEEKVQQASVSVARSGSVARSEPEPPAGRPKITRESWQKGSGSGDSQLVSQRVLQTASPIRHSVKRRDSAVRESSMETMSGGDLQTNKLQKIMEMGFTAEQAEAALRIHNNDEILALNALVG